jgi:hypothetical protein
VLEEASYDPIANAVERHPGLKEEEEEETEAMAKAVATPEALAAQLSSAALKAIGQT